MATAHRHAFVMAYKLSFLSSFCSPLFHHSSLYAVSSSHNNINQMNILSWYVVSVGQAAFWYNVGIAFLFVRYNICLDVVYHVPIFLIEPLSCFTDMRSLVMSDDRTVEEGNYLNLTCWVESYPPSRMRWTKLGSGAELNYEVSTDIEKNKNSALLMIRDVTTEDSGRYICEAAFLETSVSIYTDISVTSESCAKCLLSKHISCTILLYEHSFIFFQSFQGF